MATPSAAADDELAVLLGPSGHRVTVPRRAVWEALAPGAGHLTVDELADRVTALGHDVDLASVYRTLALFEELGIARVSRLGRGEASRWERAHPDEHFHLVCTTCGSVDHHVGELVERVRDHLADGHGFVADTVELVVTGRCGDCRAPD
jgi:Fur family ferric uptake transcriptional regulator